MLGSNEIEKNVTDSKKFKSIIFKLLAANLIPNTIFLYFFEKYHFSNWALFLMIILNGSINYFWTMNILKRLEYVLDEKLKAYEIFVLFTFCDQLPLYFFYLIFVLSRKENRFFFSKGNIVWKPILTFTFVFLILSVVFGPKSNRVFLYQSTPINSLIVQTVYDAYKIARQKENIETICESKTYRCIKQQIEDEFSRLTFVGIFLLVVTESVLYFEKISKIKKSKENLTDLGTILFNRAQFLRKKHICQRLDPIKFLNSINILAGAGNNVYLFQVIENLIVNKSWDFLEKRLNKLKVGFKKINNESLSRTIASYEESLNSPCSSEF